MKIAIIGAGRIGINLAQTLTAENNEVYVVESDESVAARVTDKLDVGVIQGSGTDPDILGRAQVSSADLVLAVTASDETNLVVCSLAALLGAKRRIARVRRASLSAILEIHGQKEFHIDEIINPELVAADSIIKTVQSPGSTEVADFAEGRLLLRGFDIGPASVLCGQRLEDLRDEDFPWPFLIVAITRKEQVFIPKGDFVIAAGDHIYVLLPASSLAEILTYIAPDVKLYQKVVISGATLTGIRIAQKLRQKIKDITLIEEDEETAERVAGELEGVRVIRGSVAEADILNECGIEAADVYIAASRDDHINLISAVLAKRMGARQTGIIAHQQDYFALADVLNIDVVINPQTLAVEQILRLVRGRGIHSVIKLTECAAETLEFVAEEGSAVTRAPLNQLKFPKDAIVGAVVTGEDVFLAKGETHIKPGQKAIVFCREHAVKKLQAMFTR
jgi:trk system potassium uptake protein TrkA